MNKAEIYLQLYDNLTWQSYTEVVEAIMGIDAHKINDELDKQSSTYAYFAGLLQKAKKELDKLEVEFEQWCAITKKEESSKCREEGSKPTDKFLEACVVSNPIYSKYRNNLIEIQHKYNLLKSLVTSLESRKDMLVQISSNSRNEAKIYQ